MRCPIAYPRTPRLLLGGAAVLLLLPLARPAPALAQGFGQALALGDGEIFVGEPLNERRPGIVHVFRAAGGEWGETQQLTAASAFEGDHFGRAIVSAGDDLLVGATSHDEGRGAVFLYRRSGSGEWEPAGKIQPADLAPGDFFGRAAAGAGDLALFATWAQAEARGAVYVFRRDGRSGEWREEAKLSASDAAPNDWFGTAIAIDGDRVAIGAFRKDEDRGAVYVFRRDAEAGAWSEEAKLSPQGPEPQSQTGYAVALRGDEAYAGAPGFAGGGGAVFAFRREADSGTWRPAGRLLPFEAARFARFGSSIRLDGEDLLVGAPGADEGRGGLFRFRRGAEGAWDAAARESVPDLPSPAGLGNLLAGGDDGMTAAALPNDDNGLGSVLLLRREAGGWSAAAQLKSEDPTAMDPIVGGEVPCADGRVSLFPCRGVNALSFLPVRALGGPRGAETNDVWGWTDPETGREIALVGLTDRTTFVDVTNPVNPVVLGWLPRTEGSPASSWRDIKVYADHAFIVSDNAGEHGMQVFDLARLRHVSDPPVTFTPDLTYDRIHSAHNIVIDTESGFAYAVGSSSGGDTCGGGLHMIDIRDPKNPSFAGCFADTSTGYERTGYTHDAQCVVYRGPDERYRGRQICFGSNETALSIADVTDKEAPRALSSATYPRVAYSHQGWLTEDQRHFYMNDEGDELTPALGLERTRTLIWDVSDLEDPIMVKEHMGETFTTDHNLYIVGDLMYQSNYVSGLRILDISDRENPVEVGFFDTVPWSEEPEFDGSWSNYPFFRSGTIVVTSGKEGVFMLRKASPELVP